MTLPQSPLKWIGGKNAAAKRIVAAFPDPSCYDTFVDVCGGAAHVLAAKPVWGHKEIYNDLDDNLVTFWQEMQVHASELQASLDAHLYSRKMYYEYYRSLFDGTELTSFDRALRWFYVLRSTGTGWIRKSPTGWNHLSSNVHSFRHALELFEAIQERFRYVAIDNRDAIATIKRYGRDPRTLLYVDPPYVDAEYYYEVSKKGFPHEEVAQALAEVMCYVALSYYPHPTIDTWYSNWRCMTWQQHKSSQIQLARREEDTATENLLCNYPDPVQSLWNDEVQ